MNKYINTFEKQQKENLDKAIRMFKDGVSYKMIKRFTGIDLTYFQDKLVENV